MPIRERNISGLFRRTLLGLCGFVALGSLPAAAEDSACGANLIAEAKREDAAKYEAIREAAKETPNGQGLLWKIERDGAKPSYLFGTMHMSDTRIVNLPEPVEEAFDTSETIVIETTDILDRSIVMREFAKRADLTMFPEGEKLTDHLTEDEQTELGNWLESQGVPLQSVIHMKPWMILSMASQPDCESKRQAAGAKILDVDLAQRAREAGKTVGGLETLGEQFEALNSFSTEIQMRALLSTAAMGDRINDVMETLVNLYVSGETGMFTPAVLELVPHDSEEVADYAEFEERVVLKRNHLMAARAQKYLNEGGAFIAVGALHLPGSEGLIELFRVAGWTVEKAY